MDYKTLKTRHRAERDNYSQNLSVRVHRALSWLNRAESSKDLDGKFVFLWIAFNAAYATEINDYQRLSEQQSFNAFISKICDLDSNKCGDAPGRLEALIWTEFSQSIRVLLDNAYVFSAFWDHHSGKITKEEWETAFASANRAASHALGNRDTAKILSIVLSRIYTLRNQIIHGGATWNGRANRDQVRDSTQLLSKLVPLTIEIMMDSPNTLWGDAAWPVVENYKQ